MSSVRPEKLLAVEERLRSLGVSGADLEERFIRSSGPGGQNVNKVATCVVLRHLPTGIEVRCRRERSQSLNRFLARRLLAERLEERQKGMAGTRQAAAEKIRRQKRRRSRRAKEKMLGEKKERGEKKASRRFDYRGDDL